jgi:hypothetical protein
MIFGHQEGHLFKFQNLEVWIIRKFYVTRSTHRDSAACHFESSRGAPPMRCSAKVTARTLVATERARQRAPVSDPAPTVSSTAPRAPPLPYPLSFDEKAKSICLTAPRYWVLATRSSSPGATVETPHLKCHGATEPPLSSRANAAFATSSAPMPHCSPSQLSAPTTSCPAYRQRSAPPESCHRGEPILGFPASPACS